MSHRLRSLGVIYTLVSLRIIHKFFRAQVKNRLMFCMFFFLILLLDCARHELGSTSPPPLLSVSHLFILHEACALVHLGPVPSHKRRFKPDMAFDPSSTSVAQTTHLCCRLPGFNYKLKKKKKVQV